jgi:hypothetical protein
MAVKPKFEIHITGPVLTGNPKLVYAVTKREMVKLAEEGEDKAKQYLTTGNGVMSGTFRNSIAGVPHKGLYVAITSKNELPIQTWIERGTRRGRRLRKGNYMFRKTKEFLDSQNPSQRGADKLVKALS